METNALLQVPVTTDPEAFAVGRVLNGSLKLLEHGSAPEGAERQPQAAGTRFREVKLMRATELLFAGGLALGCVVACVVLLRAPTVPEPGPQPVAPRAASGPITAPPPEAPQQLAPTTAEAPLPAPSAPAPEEPSSKPAPAGAKAPPATPPPQPVQRPQKEILDSIARMALSFVGADPEAEEYWYAAINDPTLSAHERQDLIEDLNEDGLSDPRRPTVEDLPLIVSRLILLEDIAPYAMDQVNADAIQEAYKDLVNMAVRLAR